MKTPITIGALALAALSLAAAPATENAGLRVWPSTPPSGCPFRPSDKITGIGFTGRHAEYTGADTWYPSWASDGAMYSPFTDGQVDGVHSGSGGEGAVTGHAKIEGDDPLSLKVTPLGTNPGNPSPYGGRYPCGSLVKDGVWYYGTYCLDNGPLGLNWEIQGPFVGFRVSADLGKTWTDTPHTPAKPLFGETAKNGAKVRIGAPHFVDFGQDMRHSPDGYAYLVAHGGTRKNANVSWISGDQVYLLRVKPSAKSINDPRAYEFYGGADAKGAPRWVRSFRDIKPLLEWNDRMGCVTATYNHGLKRYLMCVTDGWPTVRVMNTYVLESEKLTGPWRMVSFMDRFGEQAYFVNFPSKFISPDGRTAWLCYSANFTNGWRGQYWKSDPPGSKYAMCLQEVKLLKR